MWRLSPPPPELDLSLWLFVLPPCQKISRLIKSTSSPSRGPCNKVPREGRGRGKKVTGVTRDEGVMKPPLFSGHPGRFSIYVFVFIEHNRDPRKTYRRARPNKPACTFQTLAPSLNLHPLAPHPSSCPRPSPFSAGRGGNLP